MAFESFAENNLTLDEVAESTKLDKDFLLMLLNNEAQVLMGITRLIYFANFRIIVRKYNMKTFTTKHISDNVIMICRIVEPKCHIHFDKITGEFFNIKFKRKKREKKLSEFELNQILQDFKAFQQSNINKSYTERKFE